MGEPDWFLTYWGGVRSGEVVACRKLRRLACRLLDDHDSPGRWHFDAARARRASAWIERFCRQPSGRLGSPLVLEPFERAIVQTLFGFVDDEGLRRFQEAFVLVARKNGKTTLCSAVELYLLVMDGEGSPQVYNVATKYDQARLGFDAAHKMVLQSPALRARVRKRAFDLYCERNMGTIRALASNSRSLDGLDVHGAVIDELSAMTNRDIYDLVKQGMGSRRQPLLLTVTTNGFTRESIFDDQYRYASEWLDGRIRDDRFLPVVYELDERGEWEDEGAWAKANPGLGTIKRADFLRGCVGKAKADPSFLSTVLCKDFNLFVNSATAFLSWEDIENPATFDMREMGFRYAIAGIDLSSTTDLTAVSLLMKRRLPDGSVDPRIYVSSMYWLPEAVLEEQARAGSVEGRDRVPYDRWVERGLIRTCPGNKIDKRAVVAYLREFQEETGTYVYRAGYDRWGFESHLLEELQAFLGKRNAIEVRQGAKTESVPLKALKADMRAGLLVHNQNPVDMWCMRNAAVKVDENGNLMLSKKDNRAQYRIDGFAALLDAYVLLHDDPGGYEAMI
ncbi:MAG: terminase large subunit [Coriobacteriales bacterium]|jgi:phage terminase large subunit-like protein|nr:terminase large subunit [Coriobacteriales bacterium]